MAETHAAADDDLIYEVAEAIEDADNCRRDRAHYDLLARAAVLPLAERLAAGILEEQDSYGD